MTGSASSLSTEGEKEVSSLEMSVTCNLCKPEELINDQLLQNFTCNYILIPMRSHLVTQIEKGT